MLADAWSFIALSANGGSRNTEVTDTNVGAVVSYDQTLHPGVIRIPADIGDLWESINTSRNSLFRNLPTNWVSVRLKLSFAPTQNTQQINLLAYQDDDNYVAVSHTFNGSEKISMVNEQSRHAVAVGSIGVTAVNIHLRLVRDLDTGNVTGSYSLDGVNWVTVGTTWQALMNPKVGIFVGGSSSGFPNASLEQLQVITQNAPPLAQFMVQPQNLVFNAVAGQQLTSTQDLYLVVRSQDADVNWTMTNSASWLRCPETNGVTPATCHLSVNTTGLAAGVYQATLRFSSPGAVSSNVNVTLIVNPAQRVGLATWKGGRSGAMSVSTDDSYTSGFSDLMTNNLHGTFMLWNVSSIASFFTDAYGAGMELGGHTVDHFCFELNEGALRYQLENNIANILAATPVSQAELISFAYPCGFNTTRYRVVASDYYLAARGYNINQLEDAVPASFACLKSYNSHNYPPNPPADLKTLVNAAMAQGKWFNLVLHELSNDDGAIAYSVGKDIWVDTQGKVAKYIQLRDRTVITNYVETTNQIQFNSYRLPLNVTSKRNFEGAVATNDVVTFKVGVSGLSNTVSSVIVSGVSVSFTNTGSYVYFDARVTTNSQTITLSLQPNTAPTLAAKTNRSVSELTALVVTNTASDADLPAQTLIYTLTVTNVQNGSVQSNAAISGNGIITWAPTEAQGPGTYSFITRVTDVATPPLSATNTFTVTVDEINVPPALSAQSSQTVIVGVLMLVTNAGTDADLSPNPLAYTLVATNVATGAAITNASINTNGVISWTPGSWQVATTNRFITIVTDTNAAAVNEKALKATNSFTVIVRASPLELPVQNSVTLDEQSSLLVSNAAADIEYLGPAITNIIQFTYTNRTDLLANGWDFIATNPNGTLRNTEITNTSDGAVISYDQAVHPGTLRIPTDVGDQFESFNTARNCLFRSLPTNWLSVRFQLSFVPTQNTEQAHLTIYQNDNNYVQLGLVYNSGLGGLVVPFVSEVNGVAAHAWTNVTATTNIFLRMDRNLANQDLAGFYSVDGTNWLALGVYPQSLVNPRLEIWATTGQFGAAFPTPTPVCDARELIVIETNTAIRSVSYALDNPPSGAQIGPDGTISWIPTEAQGPGVYILKTAVWDNVLPQIGVTNSFTVTVNEVNAAPTLTLPVDTNIFAMTPWCGWATATDFDLPGNALAFSLISGPLGLTVAANGWISWTPDANQSGSTNLIQIRVTDTNAVAVNATSFSVTNSFVISVGPVLTVTVNNTSRVFGVENPAFSVSYSDFIDNDTPGVLQGSLVFSTPATNNSPVGTYPIYASGLTSSKYFVVYQDGQLMIAASNAPLVLGDLAAVYTGGAHAASATTEPSGLVVNLTYSGSANAPTNAGSYEVIGTISDLNHVGSATNTLVIAASNAPIVLGDLAAVYDGAAKSASATTIPSGLSVNLTYSGSANAPTNAGSYEVIGTISDLNHVGAATNTLVIAASNAPIVLGDLAAVYDGAAKSASATTIPSGLSVNLTYSGSVNAPTNAGSYEVIGTISDLNHVGAATNTLVIAPSNAPIVLGDLAAVYDGAAKSASATTIPSGLSVNLTYSGSVNAPTNAGSYEVIGTISDLNHVGAATNTLVIAASNAPLVLGDLAAVYTGGAHAASATTEPSGLVVNLTYSGSANAPTNAGSYEVIGTISDLNHVGSATNTLVIAASNAPIVLGDLAAVYDGAAKSASATTIPSGLSVNLTYSGSANAPTNAGSYEVIGTISDLNHVGAATNTLVIAASNAPIVLGDLAAVYDGAAKSASATTIPSGLSVNLTYSGSVNAPTNAGSYEVIGTISDLNHVGAATNTLVIAASNAPLVLGDLAAVYTGGAHAASATTEPSGLVVNLTYSGSANAPTNAGSYEVIGTISDLNHVGSATNTLVIAASNAPIVLGDLAAVYDGAAKSASATTIPSGLSVNLTYSGSANAPTNAGSYEVIGTISDLNHVGAATNTLVIAASNAPIVLGDLAAVYTGGAHAASATTEPSGLVVNLTYSGSANAPTNAGSYEVIGTISDLNHVGAATNTLVIAASNAPIVLGDLAAVYDGAAKSASATTIPSGLSVNLTYSGSVNAPTNAGSYEVIGTISDLNHVGAATNTLVIAASNAPLVLGDLAAVYTGGAHAASATTEPSGLVVNLTYSGSANAPTNAGSYEVIGTISDLNHVGAATNTLVIAASNAPIVLGDLAAVYDGAAKSASATTIPSGLSVNLTYSGSVNAPTNAGSYEVIGTISDLNHVGAATNTLVIAASNAPLVLGDLAAVYTGGAHAASATTEPSGLVVNLTYSGSANAPTNAGSYEVIGTISDLNHVGAATNTLVIAASNGVVTLTGLNQLYNGTARIVTATTMPSGLNVIVTYNGSNGAPTNAGTYQVIATINELNYVGGATNTLTVTDSEPIVLSLNVSGPEAVVISWNSIPDQAYRVQFKNDLSDAHWTDLAPDITATGLTTSVTNVVGSQPQRFFQVYTLP